MGGRAMSQATEQVVVVGGGVIGAACAHYLSRAGRSVTLIEQRTFGSGCSHGNCGYVCPSHILPLARPGALQDTIKTLFARNSPLLVRWRLDPAMWRWFWQFARKCNRRDMLQAGHAIQALLTSSRTLYDQLVADTLSDIEWETQGLLLVFHSQRGMDRYAATDHLLRREFDMGATRYDSAGLQALEPSLNRDVAGAWHYLTDAHLRPDKLMLAWQRVLTAQGVAIREQCQLRDLLVDGRLVRGVVTSQGEIRADQVVVAAGAWTPLLGRLLGVPIPIQPGKGYSLTMPRPKLCPRHSMIFEEHHVAATPMVSAFRIGSTMEFTGYDAGLTPARLQILRDAAAIYLREPHTEPVVESWAGWRPMTPDGLPMIGRVPAAENLLVAAGHGMLGVSMSPSTGLLVAEIASGKTPHIDPAPYALDRRL